MFSNYKFDTTVKSKLPGALWSDNGTELAGEFSEYLRQNHVTQLHNASYVPVAPIESANRTIRNILRAMFIKYQTLDWVTRLQDVAASINSNFNKKLRASPAQIMEDYFNRDDELIHAAAIRRKEAADAKFTKYSNQEIRCGRPR